MSEKTEKDVAVIGSKEFCRGFELAGVNETYGTEDYQERVEKLLDREDLGILVTEQRHMRKLAGRVKQEANSSVSPVVVSLSEDGESEMLQEKIKKAIGADITG
jgi:V/A-type H+-transporting ATPase subunit F